MCTGLYTQGATWTLRVMIWPILRLIQVFPDHQHHLFTCPYLEHSRQFMKRWINHLPIHLLELTRQEDLLISKHLLRPLFVDPEAYSWSCVWWHFLFSKEYTQWFQWNASWRGRLSGSTFQISCLAFPYIRQFSCSCRVNDSYEPQSYWCAYTCSNTCWKVKSEQLTSIFFKISECLHLVCMRCGGKCSTLPIYPKQS